MKLKPFFTYFGGKYRATPYYARPQHRTIIEPFAGSAGYSLNYSGLDVHLYDVDPIIYGVWDYLIRAKPSEILLLPEVIVDVRVLALPQEAKWLIGFWLNKGMVSPCNIPGKWMREDIKLGRTLDSYWGPGLKSRIASQVGHIKHWKISNTPYYEIENRDACWFIDPPYKRSGSHYRFHDIDYVRLGGFCKSRIGQVQVCEQLGADWLPFEPFRAIKSLEGRNGSKQSVELLYSKDRV